ncbi:hypothetical protein [Ferrimonas marina]|uniref:Uncharacterized protein n=1 Tax=Ferrimonas marina TaxID=299255 RepID=A0A1M5TYM6_9GAMM|nr:hypothetical protein [Ferrimonas marina]SHH55892.1 hypothetical protein SAMN02745129_2334 [Ferrimonas marina]
MKTNTNSNTVAMKRNSILAQAGLDTNQAVLTFCQTNKIASLKELADHHGIAIQSASEALKDLGVEWKAVRAQLLKQGINFYERGITYPPELRAAIDQGTDGLARYFIKYGFRTYDQAAQACGICTTTLAGQLRRRQITAAALRTRIAELQTAQVA